MKTKAQAQKYSDLDLPDFMYGSSLNWTGYRTNYRHGSRVVELAIPERRDWSFTSLIYGASSYKYDSIDHISLKQIRSALRSIRNPDSAYFTKKIDFLTEQGRTIQRIIVERTGAIEEIKNLDMSQKRSMPSEQMREFKNCIEVFEVLPKIGNLIDVALETAEQTSSCRPLWGRRHMYKVEPKISG